MICILQFTKGYNSVKTVGGVILFGLQTSSLYHFCESIYTGFRVIDLYIRVNARVVATYKGT